MFKKVLDIVVIVVIVGLAYYIVTLSKSVSEDVSKANENLLEMSEYQSTLLETYVGLYQTSQLQLVSVTNELEATKALYAQSETMLKNTSNELELTRSLLKETEVMLSQLREDTKSFVSMTGKALELESTSADLRAQMALIKDHLRFLSGDVKDQPEAGKLLRYFKGKIHLVKGKIKGFRRDAHELKIAAQNEHDRIKTILGNNGYLVKEGKTIQIDYAKFQAADMSGTVNAAGQSKEATPSNVDISVKIVD